MAIQRMAKFVKQHKMLTEVSVSGRGRHVFLWVQPPKESDQVLPKYKLGGGQELEVFGLPNSAFGAGNFHIRGAKRHCDDFGRLHHDCTGQF